MSVHVYEIKNGELMSDLARQLKNDGIEQGAIVALIGAADEFTVSTMPAKDATDDTPQDFTQPGEMSGTGEIINGAAHIHATFAVEGARVIGGHLISANIRTHFARVYVVPTGA